MSALTTLTHHFSSLPDPRVDRTRRHLLLDILLIAICAVICGAEHFTDIEEWAHAKEEWLRERLELPGGLPSHDTFNRVFAALDPEAFTRCFLSWVAALKETSFGEVIALDGKTLRRSFDRASGKKALHQVSAFATRARLVLGAVGVEEKSNEITAIPALLSLLDIAGAIITIDAMGTQKEIARQIVEQGADYVLAVKDNQKNLAYEVREFFRIAEEEGWQAGQVSYHQTYDAEHGRKETRECWVTSDLAWLEEAKEWTKLSSIVRVRAKREVGGKVSVEERFYISSLTMAEASGERMLAIIRSHWGIENSLHWVLDMVLREDESRLRVGNAAKNFASLRHIVLNLLRQETTLKRGLKTKQKRAGWDNRYLTHILTG